MTQARGLVIAAPASGSGKTTLTLGLLRHLARSGRPVASAKIGPDYIDPRFHSAASGTPCVNLDGWAMRPEALRALAAGQGRAADLVIIEGVMGLFDGANDGTGSTADVAAMLDLPVVLVIDVRAQSQSVAALVEGFARHRTDITVASVILNRIGSPRHRQIIEKALAPTGIPVIGALPRSANLALPCRHLGLVQADEHANLDAFMDRAADMVAEGLDLSALDQLAKPIGQAPDGTLLRPLGQRIAIARDEAFSFSYPHLLNAWQGAELSYFSPLEDQAPVADADAIYLPGGYPELHGGRLAAADRFRSAMHEAVGRGALIYGECGGFMALGDGLEDKDGTRHEMLGLLSLESSFRTPRLHLGYRRLRPQSRLPWPGRLRGHEFHYASTLKAEGEPLFHAENAEGEDLGPIGLRAGRVMGSFAHVVDCEGP